MTDSVLKKIVEARRLSVAKDKQTIDPDSLSKSSEPHLPLSLASAMKKPGIQLIAEVKSASPSRGTIRKEMSVVDVVHTYEAAGASAISILTEPDHFGGSWKRLKTARGACALPIICKDFIIDEFQVRMARANGADAILLIAAALNDSELNELISQAHELGLEVLTEAINKEELDRILAGKSDVIGINNRNLHTLEVNLNVSLDLLKNLPGDRPIVVESGIFKRHDVERLENAGADGMLVGTALMESANIGGKIKELLGSRLYG